MVLVSKLTSNLSTETIEEINIRVLLRCIMNTCQLGDLFAKFQNKRNILCQKMKEKMVWLNPHADA